MNNIIKSVSTHLIRNQRQFLLQCSRFATDAKTIEEMTKKNKVVVFMKARKIKNLPVNKTDCEILNSRASQKHQSVDSPMQLFRSSECTESNTMLTMFLKATTFARESKISQTGRQSRKSSSTASSLAAATSSSRCTKTANSSMSSRKTQELHQPSPKNQRRSENFNRSFNFIKYFDRLINHIT